MAVVYHNGKPSLYINGVWKKDGLQSLKQHVYPGTQFPGGCYGSQGDGILDEVRIWSVARTEAQIAANKDGELTGPQTGLVGYWPMNEGTGLVLHDVSGSGRDVDLTSAGYTSASWTNGRYSVASITGSYRYAFNGKELDKDIDQDDYDYGARIYDARLGKFLSVDPLTKGYPMLTPYQFASNNPILNRDIDGREGDDYKNQWYSQEGLTIFKLATEKYSFSVIGGIEILAHANIEEGWGEKSNTKKAFTTHNWWNFSALNSRGQSSSGRFASFATLEDAFKAYNDRITSQPVMEPGTIANHTFNPSYPELGDLFKLDRPATADEILKATRNETGPAGYDPGNLQYGTRFVSATKAAAIHFMNFLDDQVNTKKQELTNLKAQKVSLQQKVLFPGADSFGFYPSPEYIKKLNDVQKKIGETTKQIDDLQNIREKVQNVQSNL